MLTSCSQGDLTVIIPLAIVIVCVLIAVFALLQELDRHIHFYIKALRIAASIFPSMERKLAAALDKERK